MPVLTHRFGHRGAALIVVGLTWIAFGVTVLIQGPAQRPQVIYEYAPEWMQVATWVLTGAYAVYVGTRGPDTIDTPGMLALMVMPIIRGASFGVAAIAWAISQAARHQFPGFPEMGYREAWYAAFFWLVIFIILRLIAGWPNPRILLAPKQDRP